MTDVKGQFDLTSEPWIQVTRVDGTVGQVSLRQAFREASDIVAIAGEVPTQSFAILRLLLAILHRTVAGQDDSAVDRWRMLWAERTLPVDDVDAYLDRHRSRFDLLDPVAPFYQVAGLRTGKDGVTPLDAVIADVPNGEKYFTTRADAQLERIDFAEAARWLVHTHAFDPSGIRSGAVGDARVKGGRGYPIGTGWAGALGGVVFEGVNLVETLLLNLVLLDRDEQPLPVDDLPVWERNIQGASVRADPTPAGPADLFTWQSRRIRLVRDGNDVTGVVLCQGDPIEPFNQQHYEYMTAWRYSEAQSKKHGTRHYPRTHDPERAFWRGFTSLLAEVDVPSSETKRTLPPGGFEWMSILIDADAVEPTQPIRLHAIGISYGSNNSVIDDIVDDSVMFQVVLLSSDPVLRQTAVNCAHGAEQAVAALASLAGNLAVAAGGDPGGDRSRARERGYHALDAPFRQWLTKLTRDCDSTERAVDWQVTAHSIVRRLGAELVDASGAPAWVGRQSRNGPIDSALAESWFYKNLREALPGAFVSVSTDGGSAA